MIRRAAAKTEGGDRIQFQANISTFSNSNFKRLTMHRFCSVSLKAELFCFRERMRF